jgi:hypothetical protein
MCHRQIKPQSPKSALESDSFLGNAMSTFEILSFYRGTSGNYTDTHPYVSHVRKDRAPKDSSVRFHTIADQWFYKKFGIKHRSQSLFVTSRRLTAQTYAATPSHVIRVVPISTYRYCWTPLASDLLFAAEKMKESPACEIEEHLESLEYQDSNLVEAHKAGHEVMLHCEQYIAIPVHLLAESLDTPNSTGLILLQSFQLVSKSK